MIGLINGKFTDSAGEITSSPATIIQPGTDLIASIVEDTPGVYYLASGTHVTGTALDFTKLSGVHIIGLPGAVLQQSGANAIIEGTAPSNTQYGINAITSGDRAITTDTAGDAGNFSAGDMIKVTDGTDQMVNEVVAVDGGTGVIDTLYPWGSAFGAGATVELISSTPTENFILENVEIDSNGQAFEGLKNQSGAKNCQVRNIIFSGGETTGNTKIEDVHNMKCFYENITNTKTADHSGACFKINLCTDCKVQVRAIGSYSAGTQAGVSMSNSWYCKGDLGAIACQNGVYIHRGGGGPYNIIAYENVANGVVGSNVEYTTFTGVSRNNGTNSAMSGTTNTVSLRT